MSEVTRTFELTQPLWARLCTVIKAMEIHIKFNGQMMLTRTATPANLRAIATEFTGRTYPRSRKGLETAHRELSTLQAKLMSAFESGESQVIDA